MRERLFVAAIMEVIAGTWTTTLNVTTSNFELIKNLIIGSILGH